MCYLPFKYRLVTDIPEKYVLSNISVDLLEKRTFDVEKIDEFEDAKVRTFFVKLRIVLRNGTEAIGTSETYTDSLVDDLLRIVEMNDWPLMIQRVFIRSHYDCYNVLLIF